MSGLTVAVVGATGQVGRVDPDISAHQRQQMCYLGYLLTLSIIQDIQVFGESGKRIVGCSCHSYTALKTIRIIVDHSIKRIRCSTHHYVP